MVSEKNWKDILHVLYIKSSSSTYYGPGKIGYTDDHLLAKELKISGHELYGAINFFKENDLIEEQDVLYLTKKGFDVAFQNEKLINEEKIQQRLLGFTAIITLSSFCTFLVILMPYRGEIWYPLIIATFLFALVIIAFGIKPPKKRKGNNIIYSR